MAFKFLLHRIRNFSAKMRIYGELFCLLPDFYKIYLKDSKRIWDFRASFFVDNLKKISSWHSNFPKLIDFWRLDKNFNKIFTQASKIKGNYKIRCFMLYQFLNNLEGLEGEIAEVGVYKGRSAKVLALAARKYKKKKIYLFDTFEGMPESDPKKDNFYKKGHFADTSYEEVRKFFSKDKNVKIYPGFFPETAKQIRNKKFCFAHVDVDIYQSVKDCCQFFYPRIVKRGIMLFDDPGFSDCKGAKIAMDEFFEDKKESPIYLATGQAFVIKF